MNQVVRVDPLIGKSVAGRYRVVRLIGEGGMGSVYELEHTRIQRKFALKALTPLLAKHPEALGRFQREAEVVAKLRHPHIVDIVDWAQLDDGSPCMIIEYLDGEDLAARIERSGPLPWGFLARIADETMAALTVAHRAGIVHRDLKPDNIFLSRDGAGGEHVKLLDFGISKIQDSSTFSTTNAAVLGTPAYMSPEQAYGQTQHIGPATDVWAMGALLYEMATGHQAFWATNVPAILHRVCNGYAAPIHQFRPDAPDEFVEMVDRALSRDPQRRLTDIVALRDRLQLALGSILTGPIFRAPTAGPPNNCDPSRFAMATPIPGRAPRGTSANAKSAWGRPGTAVDAGNEFAFAPTAAAQTAPELHTAPTAPEPRRRRVGISALAIAAIVVVAAVAVARSNGDGPDAAGPPQIAAGANPEPIAATPEPVAAAEPEPEPEPEPAPQLVTIAITSTPAGANVYRGAQLVGTTPLSHETERSDAPAHYRITRDGYRDATLAVGLGRSDAQHVTLTRKRASRASLKKKRSKRRRKRNRSSRDKPAATATPPQPQQSTILDW